MSLTNEQLQRLRTLQGVLSSLTYNYEDLTEDIGDLAAVLDYIESGGVPTITSIAKQGSNANADISTILSAVKDGNDTAIGMLKDQTNGLAAIKTAIGNIDIDTSDLAKEETAQEILRKVSAGADAYEVEVQAGKEALVNAIEAKGGEASTAMSLTGIAQAIDSIQMPTQLQLNAITFVNNADQPIIDMGGVGILNMTALSFSDFGAVKEIRNFPRMPLLTSLSGAFRRCYSLKIIDFSGFDISNVTNISEIFFNDSSLETLDMSMLDVSNVVIMNYLFHGCSSLRTVNICGWNAIKVTGNASMFGSCGSLETLVGGKTYEEVVADDIKVLNNLNISLTGISSTKLDRASLRALINGLADRTGQSALTLTIGATLIAKLSAEDIAVATNKNWTLA